MEQALDLRRGVEWQILSGCPLLDTELLDHDGRNSI